jgi:hypothetical protein
MREGRRIPKGSSGPGDPARALTSYAEQARGDREARARFTHSEPALALTHPTHNTPMALVKAVCAAMERIAPLKLAEKWDNVCAASDPPPLCPR